MDPEIVAAVNARRETFIDGVDKKTYHRYSGKKTGRGGIVTSNIVAAELTKELKKKVTPGNVRYIGAGPEGIYGMHEHYSPSWKIKVKERRKAASEAKRKANNINQARADAESPDKLGPRVTTLEQDLFKLQRSFNLATHDIADLKEALDRSHQTINILIARCNSQDARLDALEGNKKPLPEVVELLETHVNGSDQT